MPNRPNILICTVGTSLFYPNLERLKNELQRGTIASELRPLAEAYIRQDWEGVAQELLQLDPNDRICGAEINSIASMVAKQYVPETCRLFFMHSDTDEGQHTASILKAYYEVKGHPLVEIVKVEDLQDQVPKRFRTHGLRNLARQMCKVIHEHSAEDCAINATGGYKAQIAIAVLIGQALSIPVYYKHERFDEIISFPPMPISFDFDLWMRASGMLESLAGDENDLLPASDFEEEWDEKYESLVERETIDGVQYLTISPTGIIFHEAFRGRFYLQREQLLPPPAPEKKPPYFEDAGWPGRHPEIKRFLEKLTNEVPQIVQCRTYYYNPDLSKKTKFYLRRGEIEGLYSNGTYTVKFTVLTTAKTEGQKMALHVVLNEWLRKHQ